jgi:hypothetical protein
MDGWRKITSFLWSSSEAAPPSIEEAKEKQDVCFSTNDLNARAAEEIYQE